MRDGDDVSAQYLPTPEFNPPTVASPLHFFAWVAVSRDSVVLIDTGADQATTQARGVLWERSPLNSLARLGIEPTDIDHVVVTHMHWDHVGNLRAFPRAVIHLNPNELAYVTSMAMRHRFLRRLFDLEQVKQTVALAYQGRINPVSTPTQVVPGVSVHPAAGHTPGTQICRVTTARGAVVLASDARHLTTNTAGGDSVGSPYPILVDVASYCDSSQLVDDLAPSGSHIVPGHDPLTSSIYPVAADELIVQLHMPPAHEDQPLTPPREHVL